MCIRDRVSTQSTGEELQIQQSKRMGRIEKKAKKEVVEIPPEEDLSEDDSEDEEEDPFPSSDSEEEVKETEDMIPLEKPSSKKRRKTEPITNDTEESSIVYLGRIPYGFFEEQMRAFFSQFGQVKRLRLSRSKRTGNSKHYAFLEFESPEIANIVQDSMNDYFLYGHKLSCKVMPKSKVHPDLFKGANRKFKKIPYQSIAKEQHNKDKQPKEIKKTSERLLKKEKKLRSKIQGLGIDYTFSGYQGTVAPTIAKK
eukprot:TRINITY_DN541_c0_g1_i1.p1 TRINITY_DN541_c0_g1~~TRINITY_DN541_c0_g1_i1.p1  ORF type:complete len:254 (+),score=68.89 TRINITY_DN541_c0_g1_i1:60-821(+)